MVFLSFSKGGLYGGGSELFYSQFELHTREQKMNQIVLLKVSEKILAACLTLRRQNEVHTLTPLTLLT